MNKKYISLSILLMLVVIGLSAQESDDLWTKSDLKSAKKSNIINRKDQPTKFQVYNLNLELLKSKLTNVPIRTTSRNQSDVYVTFPDANGKLKKYSVVEAEIIEEGLQQKYPEIKSYVGKSLKNAEERIRFSITPLGLHAIILGSSTGTNYINAYSKDKLSYLVYAKKDLPEQESIKCGFKDETNLAKKFERSLKTQKLQSANDGYLRSFRIAVATTGEYSQYILEYYGTSVGASESEKKSVVLSSIIETMTDANAVFERDVGLTLVLVGNNENIIFLEPETDGFTNNSQNILIGETPSVINNTIGPENFDVGHTFFTGGGGGTGNNIYCTPEKAIGVSTVFPNNYITFVHEVAHQFGALHSFNSCQGSPDSGGPEPGSGSTIMSYAGACPGRNVQALPDDYFHVVNINEMWSNISADEKNCATLITINNSAPFIETLSNNVIPILTPFILDAIATDNEGDNLTYTWEQMDTEVVEAPPIPEATSGPAFRSLPPDNNSFRHFPSIGTIVNGNLSNNWEVLPSEARNMTFAVNVRDNNLIGGQTNSMETTITFDANSGPFKIISQSTDTSWGVGTIQSVIWDVANTDIAPVNCTLVNILMSTDGGFTFPIQLDSNVPNDGNHDILVPNVSTFGARIKVEAVDNIFYSVNTGFISINPPVGKTFVPDDNFEQALIDLGYDDILDNYVETLNITNIVFLDISNRDILLLRGIEDFINLQTLNCNNNKLLSLDLSGNLELIELYCGTNHIEDLEISENSKLTTLICNNNQLKLLGLENNQSLNLVHCSANGLTELDVSQVNNLQSLIAYGNNLYCIQVNQNQLDNLTSNWSADQRVIYRLDCVSETSNITLIPDTNFEQALIDLGIDGEGILNGKVFTSDIQSIPLLNITSRNIDDLTGIEGFTSLSTLLVSGNNLSTLDVSNNTNLAVLIAESNQLSSIDVSNNPNLVELRLSFNQFSNLDLSNNSNLSQLWLYSNPLQSLDISNITNLEIFNVEANTLLNCIKVSQEQYDNIPSNWGKDANAVYSLDCSDDDNDGVTNDMDQCPDTPNGETVNTNGCSQTQLDDDEDGVFNNLDQCPDTPNGESVDSIGCSQTQLDEDEDGVTNDMDQCPDTPIGESVDDLGCSTGQIDTDVDGVNDDVDQCPNTPLGETVDENGCSNNQSFLDDDNDGVANVLDQCPNTLSGQTVDENGCMVFSYDAFTLYTESTTCPGVANGQLEISASAETNAYVFDVQIEGNGIVLDYEDMLSYNNPLPILDLAPGTYSVTISLENGFTIVFDQVVISETDDLTADKQEVNANSKTALYKVSGNLNYYVSVNQKVYSFKVDSNLESTITIPLEKGENNITIKGADCQSVFMDQIILPGIVLYPNPVSNGFYVSGPYKGKAALFTSTGILIKEIDVETGNFIGIQELPAGAYFLHFKNGNREILKIIKQ